jgi:hypothetical protein
VNGRAMRPLRAISVHLDARASIHGIGAAVRLSLRYAGEPRRAPPARMPPAAPATGLRHTTVRHPTLLARAQSFRIPALNHTHLKRIELKIFKDNYSNCQKILFPMTA